MVVICVENQSSRAVVLEEWAICLFVTHLSPQWDAAERSLKNGRLPLRDSHSSTMTDRNMCHCRLLPPRFHIKELLAQRACHVLNNSALRMEGFPDFLIRKQICLLLLKGRPTLAPLSRGHLTRCVTSTHTRAHDSASRSKSWFQAVSDFVIWQVEPTRFPSSGLYFG